MHFRFMGAPWLPLWGKLAAVGRLMRGEGKNPLINNALLLDKLEFTSATDAAAPFARAQDNPIAAGFHTCRQQRR